MRRQGLILLFLILTVGCSTTQPTKVMVWETADIPHAYDVIGPVSVNEEVTEKTEDIIQGLAGFIAKDGRISGQVPPETKAALELKREKYKDMIFDKLASKAKEYGADAVIKTEYLYVPPYATFSTKATVSAKGTMVKYKK